MASADDSKELRLKKKIGFDQRINTVTIHSPKNLSIVTNFPDVKQFLQSDTGWSCPSIARVTASTNKTNVIKTIRYEKGAERLSISYSNFMTDYQAAQNAMIKEACNNSLFDSLHVTGPIDIGDISLVAIGSTFKELLFVKQNVFVIIRTAHSTFDIFPLARWIQSQMTTQPAADITNWFPVPSGVTIRNGANIENLAQVTHLEVRKTSISPPKNGTVMVRLGEPLVIRIAPPVNTDVNRYDLEQNMGENFDPVGMEGLGLFDRAIKPIKVGVAIYKYTLIDRQTLLSYPGEIILDVHP
ncbi:MAG: hypothetical protein IPL96_06530 [Holophagaceae bacterium]|nr:hypothetical protein [Holophagaceae bacterium]